jgi:hypothetical protein
MPTGPKPRTLEQAWNHLLATKTVEGDCWLITYGFSTGIGYKKIRAQGRDWYIHALAYFLEHGKIAEGLVHRHTCHKPNCFNPAHIIAGTQAENIADKVTAQRQPVGTRHYKSVLTDDDVRAIRASSKNLGELSREFGISRGGILKIRNYESWKHVQ